MADVDQPSGVRLAELVAALSLATDLGLGQPQEHVLRQTVIARRLAEEAGLSEWQRSASFYVSLLAWVGCVSDSHEMAMWFGDDRQLRADSYQVDKTGVPLMRFMVGHVGLGSSPWRRLTMISRFLAGGFGDAGRSMVTHCETTADLADRLQLDGGVHQSLRQAFERWDGQGVPGTFSGEAIDPVMRVVQIADDAEVFHRVEGIDASVEMLRSRRGTEFDPDLVDVFCAHADELLGDLDGIDIWDAAIGEGGQMEPDLTEGELTEVLRAFGDYADLKSPSWLGHSAGVAGLAAEAARRMGMPVDVVDLIERAALVHDLGAIGVSSGVWDKPGPLSVADRERVRTHPYLTERVLARAPRLAEIGTLAALHHERLDGSGYPHGVRRDAIPLAARVVAVADVYHALGETRPHRAALTASEAATVVRDEVRAGRLDGEVVNAILASAGHRVRRRPELPAGLTPREAEVLVLMAMGQSNKQIARELSVSASTVGTHIEHVYQKIGVSTRGAAAMFAMRHGLVGSGNGDTNIG